MTNAPKRFENYMFTNYKADTCFELHVHVTMAFYLLIHLLIKSEVHEVTAGHIGMKLFTKSKCDIDMVNTICLSPKRKVERAIEISSLAQNP